MKHLNQIGLAKEQTSDLIKNLDELLANYSIFYQNVRGFHWKITGSNFFELHAKFEELYNDLFIKIDDVAERILTLGGKPTHNFSEYLKQATIKEYTASFNGNTAMNEILNSFRVLLTKQRTILEVAALIGDEGSSALMSDYIREQEKLVWMYTSFLKK